LKFVLFMVSILDEKLKKFEFSISAEVVLEYIDLTAFGKVVVTDILLWNTSAGVNNKKLEVSLLWLFEEINLFVALLFKNSGLISL